MTAIAVGREHLQFGYRTRRTWTVLLASVFAVTYVAVYTHVISPLYVESGMANNLPEDVSLALAVALAVLPAVWLPLAGRRPSAIALWIVYITGYVPSMVMPAFLLGDGWGLMPYWLALAASFVVAVTLTNRARFRLPMVGVTPSRYRWLLIGFAIVGMTTATALFGIPSGLPALDSVSDVRDEFSVALEQAGRLGGYAVWWTGTVVAPLLIAYGVWIRRPLMVAGGFGLFALVYGLAAFRSIIFTALVLVALMIVMRRVPSRLSLVTTTIATALVAICVVLASAGWFVPLSLGVRRLLMVPGQVISYYYEHFADGPHYLLSHSILAGIAPAPYETSPPVLIGSTYFGQAQNANGNLWADGLANLGIPGLIAASLLFAVLLIGLDAAARGKPLLVAGVAGGLSAWSVTNSGLLTATVTHGIALTAAMIWLLPRRGRTGTPSGRVAHLTSVHRSDDPRILLKECASLAQAGFEVVLIGRGEPPVATPPGVRFVSAGNPKGRLARMTTMPIRVFIQALRVRAHAYHIHDPELLPVALLLKLTGARVFYDVHEDLPRQIEYKEYLPPWSRRPLGLLAGGVEQACVRLMDAVVAATPRIAARFPTKKVIVVQNFPLMSEFGSRSPTRYSDRPMLVAYVGRLTEAVGARVMLQAAAVVDRTDVRFVIAGPIESSLRSTLASDIGPVRVELPGWLGRDQVQELLDQARVGMVLFQPVSNYVEAYPTKLFEYMASGVPVVASDFPLWRQIVESADCGLLVDPTDVQAVAAAVRRLLDDPEMAEAMGMRGRQAVLAKFLWDEQADRLASLYRRMLRS